MEHDTRPSPEERLTAWVSAAADPHALHEEDRARLEEMARSLSARSMPEGFITSALASTAAALADLRRQAEAADEAFQRLGVQQFIAENAASVPAVAPTPRREWKQLERERLLNHTVALLRDARRARARHEIKKTRSELLKIDQRHLRRVLGSEGADLCNQITGLLRSMSSKI